MKIIDWSRKGNLIRFFLGKDDCTDYYGDDWDDFPYEHNAGPVYEEFVCGYIDVVIPFDYTAVEPEDDWKYGGNSPYCKNSFKEQKAPCLVIGKDDEYWSIEYSTVIADKHAVKIYLDTNKNDVIKDLEKIGGRVIKEVTEIK